MTLIVENLSFTYGRLAALREISARAEPGTITAVLGPNAAGKSTVLKCIIGALKPKRGRVLMGSDPVHGMSARQIATRLAYVPQRSIVSAAFTVRQVIELGRYALPANASAVEAAIDRLDLREVADRPYPKLSVGQQQRVTLARSVAQLGYAGQTSPRQNEFDSMNQKTLVLDEPTSAMDLQHVGSCVSLLRELAQRGVTILLAMHDLSLAAWLADRVWLLDEGRMIASGSADDVLTAERLQAVFRTRFQWIDLPDGSRRLIAQLSAESSATIPVT